MLMPLFFVIFSLLSWAWLSDTWLAAAVLLSIILFSKSTTWRWNITQNQFHRWGDLSSILTALMIAYVYLVQSAVSQPIFIVLKWLPVLFTSVLFAQLFSQQQSLPLGALFYSMRKRPHNAANSIDFQLPYAGLTLLSAGAANHQGNAYYIITVTLFVSILFVARPRKSSKIIWLLLISIAIISGYFGHRGLQRLHYWVEAQSVEWLSNWDSDPFKGQTSIGDLGDLKLSDKIEFRIKADEPLLLHQASYNQYNGKTWHASSRTFTSKNPVKNTDNIPLKKMEVIQAFDKTKILALPDGTVDIKGLEGSYFEYTGLGAVKLNQAPSLGQYQVFYTGKRRDKNVRQDSRIPTEHQDWLLSFSEQLQLEGLEPQAIANKIKNHFHKNFYYSLYLGDETDANLALKDFILNRKKGHCEYFAVATVLLLRQANIPARLANGYMVEEYDAKQGVYIVRRRHAHAWAIAYINGTWQAVDSTPSQWLEMEADNASWLQPLNDWFSERLLAFKQWRIQQAEKDSTVFWLAAVVLLLLYLALRIYSARRQLGRKALAVKNALSQKKQAGLDSEFYLIEQYFKNTSQARDENESIQQWIQRIKLIELNSLSQLHYQLRFDPLGLSKTKRDDLQQQVNEWLEKTEGGNIE